MGTGNERSANVEAWDPQIGCVAPANKCTGNKQSAHIESFLTRKTQYASCHKRYMLTLRGKVNRVKEGNRCSANIGSWQTQFQMCGNLFTKSSLIKKKNLYRCLAEISVLLYGNSTKN